MDQNIPSSAYIAYAPAPFWLTLCPPIHCTIADAVLALLSAFFWHTPGPIFGANVGLMSFGNLH